MADFRPFQAWRYDLKYVSIGEVMAPPYDVISPGKQNHLYEASPYNCVRLILNRQEPSDKTGDERYERARDCFREWQKSKILTRDRMPGFYLYRQVFADPRRGGLKERFAVLGRLRLEPFEKGIVVPHEKTLARPKADRLKLLTAAQANFSPIFGLYDDPHFQMQSLFAEISKGEPLFEITDEEGVRHALWRMDLGETVTKVRNFMKDRVVYIADGHHRYQTCLDYALRKRAASAGAVGGEPASDFTLAAMVSFQDPGVELLPTHRVLLLQKGFKESEAVGSLRPYFEVQSMSLKELAERLEWDEGERLKAPEKPFPPVLGLVTPGGGSYHLKLLDPGAAAKNMPAGMSEAWYRLDVNILNYLILGRLWKIGESKWESALRFTHSFEEAVTAAHEKSVCAVFLMNALPVGMLRELGRSREVMPQKSTYFYPKLASGLVFYEHGRP